MAIDTVIKCFLLDHPDRRTFKLIDLTKLVNNTTFSDLCVQAEQLHATICKCNQVIAFAFITTPDWTTAWLAGEDPNTPMIPAITHGQVIRQLEDLHGTDNRRHILFSVKQDIPPDCMPLKLINDRVFVPNVASNRVRLPSPLDCTFNALQDTCFINKIHCIRTLSSKPGKIELALRPPGYGRSTLLHMLADIHDLRPQGHAIIPHHLQSLPLKRLPFGRASSMVLLIDLGVLDIGNLATSLKELLKSSAMAFAEKYHMELQCDLEDLRSSSGFRAFALIGSALLQERYKIFLGIDNYTAPFERSPEGDWERITSVLDDNLYIIVLNLIKSKRLAHGFFVGNSLTVNSASQEALKRTYLDFRNRHDPWRSAFTGMVCKYTLSASFDPVDFQDAMGLSEEDIRALGDTVLPPETGGGHRLWSDVEGSMVSTTYIGDIFDDPPIRMYSTKEVLDRVRHILGRPNDDEIYLTAYSRVTYSDAA